MEATAGRCEGCGGPLPGRRRKWCSEFCRKRSYWRPCEKCGDPCGGVATGHGNGGTRFCVTCGGEVAGALGRERHRPRRELVEALWSDGVSCKGICEAIGVAPRNASTHIARMRARGYNLPVRNAGASRGNKGAKPAFGRIAV
jgi:hypothetical protein